VNAPEQSYLAIWFHSFILQKTPTFAIAILMTSCHFNGFFPSESLWLIVQLFAFKARKQNGENVQRESKSGVPLVPKLTLLVPTPADFSGQCQTRLQDLELSLHSWCSRPTALISFFTGARSIHSL